MSQTWMLICGTLLLFVKCISSSCPSDAQLTEPEAVITSPNYPNPYPTNQHCNWTVTVLPHQTLAVYITTLDLPDRPSPSQPCDKDYVSFTEQGKDKIYQCGSGDRVFTIEGHQVLIEFISDNQADTHKGFNLNYKAIGCANLPVNDDLYRVTYGTDIDGFQTAHVVCTGGGSMNSTCNFYTWSPPPDNITQFCTSQMTGYVTMEMTTSTNGGSNILFNTIFMLLVILFSFTTL